MRIWAGLASGQSPKELRPLAAVPKLSAAPPAAPNSPSDGYS
jgi:hypothetical protein